MLADEDQSSVREEEGVADEQVSGVEVLAVGEQSAVPLRGLRWSDARTAPRWGRPYDSCCQTAD